MPTTTHSRTTKKTRVRLFPRCHQPPGRGDCKFSNNAEFAEEKQQNLKSQTPRARKTTFSFHIAHIITTNDIRHQQQYEPQMQLSCRDSRLRLSSSRLPVNPSLSVHHLHSFPSLSSFLFSECNHRTIRQHHHHYHPNNYTHIIMVNPSHLTMTD